MKDDCFLVALNRIKDIVDAYKDGRIHITTVNDDFDAENHKYSVSAIIGLIGNHINEAFRNYENLMKGEDDYGNC